MCSVDQPLGGDSRPRVAVSFHMTIQKVPESLLRAVGDAEIDGTQSPSCRCSQSEVNRK